MKYSIKFRKFKHAKFSFLHPVYKSILWVIKPKPGKYFKFEKQLTFKRFRLFTTYKWSGFMYGNKVFYNIIIGGKYSITLEKHLTMNN